jgi:hypothetical protein
MFLAGESGLGKTTFTNNLISSYAISKPACNQDGTTTTLSQFQGDSESLRTVLEPMMVPECSRRVIISIQVGRRSHSKRQQQQQQQQRQQRRQMWQQSQQQQQGYWQPQQSQN